MKQAGGKHVSRRVSFASKAESGNAKKEKRSDKAEQVKSAQECNEKVATVGEASPPKAGRGSAKA